MFSHQIFVCTHFLYLISCNLRLLKSLWSYMCSTGDALMSTFHLPVPGTKRAPDSLCCGVKLITSSYLLGERKQRYKRPGINLALAYVFRSQLILLKLILIFVLKPVIWWAGISCGKLSGQLRAAFMINLLVSGTDINPYRRHVYSIGVLFLHQAPPSASGSCSWFEITEIKLSLQMPQIVVSGFWFLLMSRHVDFSKS